MTVPIKMLRVEWKALEQYGDAYCVTFHLGFDPYAFDAPILVPKDTPEEDVLKKARASLHDLTAQIAEQTAGWKK